MIKLPELSLGGKVLGICLIYGSMTWGQSIYKNIQKEKIMTEIQVCVQKIKDEADSEFITDEMYDKALRCGEPNSKQ